MTLRSEDLRVYPTDIPRMGVPEAKILDPVGSHNWGTTLSSRDPVREGDFFFIFERGACLGTAVIKKNGSSYSMGLDRLGGTQGLKDLKGKMLVFFRPAPQYLGNSHSVREWAIRIPSPKPHPLFAKYEKNRMYEKLAGEVITHDPASGRLRLKVVVDVKSSPLGGAPAPGGGTASLVTTTYDFVEVIYTPRTDEIPEGAKKDIRPRDHVGVFYKKGGDKHKLDAVLIHLLSD